MIDDLDKVISLVNSCFPFIADHDFLELTANFNINLPLNHLMLRQNYKDIDTAGFLNHLRQAFSCAADIADMVSSHMSLVYCLVIILLVLWIYLHLCSSSLLEDLRCVG